MPIGFVKRNGAWVQLKKLYVKKNGTWTNLATGYLKKNGVWVKIFSAAGPSLNSSPTITGAGDGKLFSTYTATNGSWDGVGLTYTRQWTRSDAETGPFTNISGATATTYVTTSADDGKWISVTVRATDSNGLFAEAAAAPKKIVKYAPVNLTKSITGTASDGSTLTATSTWTATTTNTNDTSPDPTLYAYLWMYEDGTSATNTNTNSTYILDSDDVNKKLKVKITATNSGGSTEVTTAVTATVTAGLGAFTINNVAATNGLADAVSISGTPTYNTTDMSITYSFSGADSYQTAAWGAAFSPDGSAAAPARGPFSTLNTTDFWYYDESGVATVAVRGASPVAKATVSWGASAGAAAYVVAYKINTDPATDSGYLAGQTSFSRVTLDGETFTLISVTAYENADGSGQTKTGTLPSTLQVTPTITWSSYATADVTIPTPFVTPTFGGSNPSWTSGSNFQRTTQTTPITGRRLASNVAYIYHSGNNSFKANDSVTIAGVSTTFNGTYTVTAVGSDANGSYIRYSKTASNVAYATVSNATISTTSGIRWGWTNGTRTWLGSVDTSDYGWYWQVAINTADGYGSWGSGWKKYTTTDSSTLVNNTAYKYVVNSNTTETGEVYGSTAARYGRIQPYSKGTDGNYYYPTTYTGWI